MPPRAAAARSLPCSLDAGCAGFYAGAWRAAARVPHRAAAARSLPCSLDAGGAGSDLARGGPSAIDITGNHGFAGSSMLDTWLPQHRAFCYERVWLCNAFKSQIHRSEFQTLVHRGLHQNTIYGRMDGVYQTNAREKAATSSFTVMNASSQPCPGSIQWLTKTKTKSLHNSNIDA